MDRVVVASPVHRHKLIVVFFSKHALDRLFVDFIRTHSDRALKLVTFVIGQVDDDGVFVGAKNSGASSSGSLRIG